MFYVRHSTRAKHRIHTALSSQLFKNCTFCAVFNSGFEQSTKPIKWSFGAHPCAELKDILNIQLSAILDGFLGRSPKRYLEDGRGFREIYSISGFVPVLIKRFIWDEERNLCLWYGREPRPQKNLHKRSAEALLRDGYPSVLSNGFCLPFPKRKHFNKEVQFLPL